jgi:hypothetical protein
MAAGHSFEHHGRAVTGAGHLSARPARIVAMPTNPQADSPSIPAYFTGQGACRGCTTPP